MQLLLSSLLFLLHVFATAGRRFGPPPIASPSKISRVRFSIRGTKLFMPQSYEDTQVVDVYNLRFSWLDPYEWNDHSSDGRTYEYSCWVTRGKEFKTLTHRFMDARFQGYTEPLRFPPNFDATVQCKVRAKNSAGMIGDWRYSKPLRTNDIPVYIQGFGDIDVRGIPNKKILEILRS